MIHTVLLPRAKGGEVASIIKAAHLIGWQARSHPQACVATLSGGFLFIAERLAGQGFVVKKWAIASGDICIDSEVKIQTLQKLEI